MKYLINKNTLTDIGDAIRARTGGTSLITPENMIAEIDSISVGPEAPNGSTWVRSNAPSGYWKALCHVDGLWIAGDSKAKGFYYSEDNGKTWKASNVANRVVYDIKHNGVIYVGNTTSGLYYSTNGKTWTQSNITSGTGYEVNYGNNIWVACKTGLYYSTDGKTWTQSNITSGTFYNARYNGKLWVASGTTGIYYSTDGKTWTQSNITLSSGIVRCNDSVWIVGTQASGIYYSADGKTWTQSSITSGRFSDGDICFGNDLWVAGGTANNGLYYSEDNGKTWVHSNNTTGDFGSHYTNLIVYENNQWIAGGTSKIYYSADGKTWAQSDYNDWCNEVACGGGVWISGGDTGIWYTPIGGEGLTAWKRTIKWSETTTQSGTLNVRVRLDSSYPYNWVDSQSCTLSGYTPTANDFVGMELQIEELIDGITDIKYVLNTNASSMSGYYSCTTYFKGGAYGSSWVDTYDNNGRIGWRVNNGVFEIATAPAFMYNKYFKGTKTVSKSSTANYEHNTYVTSDNPSAHPSSGTGTDGYTYSKIGSAGGSGKTVYVWNKSEKKTTTTNQTTNYTITAHYSGMSTVCYLSIPSGVSLTQSDIYNLVCYGQNGDPFSFRFDSSGEIWLSVNGVEMEPCGTWSYTNGASYISIPYVMGQEGMTYQGTKTVTRTTPVTSTTTTNLGEVTSENRNAYPDSGQHTDGYYYTYVGERVE